MLSGILTFLIIGILLFTFEPSIDITSNNSVVIWFNWKNKRVYKFLWENK